MATDTLTKSQKLVAEAKARHEDLIEAGYQLASIPPRDHERVRVAHVMAVPSYNKGATGKFDGLEWSCSVAFISEAGRVYFAPTHWAPVEVAQVSK
jgi:hypothetical protein